MNAVDTNVLVYRLDRSEPVKRAQARDLIRRLVSGTELTVLPWQVLGELVRQLRYWQDCEQLSREAFLRYTSVFRQLFPVVMPTESVLDNAIKLTGQYSLSHWDAMLLGACLEVGVEILYTEDMGAPATYDTIQLVNPFAPPP
jgi:predicted nucleic acid-binding protein